MDIRVMLMDDNEVFRRGLMQLIDQAPWGHVIAQTGSMDECLRTIGAVKPDILLLDFYISRGEKSFAYVNRLKELSPTTKIVMLTMSDEDVDVHESTRYPVDGYLLSSSPFSQIEQGILDVYSGKVVLASSLGASLYRHLLERSNLEALTMREREILSLVQQGKTNREIAAQLFVSEFTVKAHVSNILEKTGCSKRSELASL